ncbi:enoyl-CoA hydratase/isomerase family protein [Hymenobacter pini]|uniref:enoyl-CoA hydratase/isomerase family protein n=1 Tax=Hymenobacter pini TaxID=2880879 RepID=UPI001CF40F3C|nr:enoyl-CoA hydratase-related protein [Hymenobacter pini]MCA8831864.1 enoyl-CoA hydratase/isomerase family protein [Hymenobacter pini]
MTTFTNLLYQAEPETGILTLTVNRPDKLNALNAATIQEIRAAVEQAQQDPAVRGIILTGSGEKSFVAGADIAELTQLDEAAARRVAEQGQEAFRFIEESHKPVLAAVNGFALGGGCELAMACHMRIAADNARFGQPEVNLGLLPGYGGTQRLTQLIGKGKAIELLLTADMLKADEALRLGLVNHVVPQAELLNFTRQLLQRILTKAPIAVGLCIDAVNAHFDKGRDGYQAEAESFGRCFNSADFREGTSAFLEKRPAAFTGK